MPRIGIQTTPGMQDPGNSQPPKSKAVSRPRLLSVSEGDVYLITDHDVRVNCSAAQHLL
jgi:hypothetical protein